MIHLLLPRHAVIAGAVVLSSLTVSLASETPTPQELAHATTAGSYLAARHAGVERESGTAAAYYLNVLKADPRNADLLSRTFLSVLTNGDIDEAGRLADRLLQLDRTDRIARLVLGVRALKQKQYGVARQNFAQSVRGPVTDLTATLLAAWAQSGTGDTQAARSKPWTTVRAGLVRHLQGSARGHRSSTSPTTKRTPASVTSAPTRPTRWHCAPCRPMAISSRAPRARTKR